MIENEWKNVMELDVPGVERKLQTGEYHNTGSGVSVYLLEKELEMVPSCDALGIELRGNSWKVWAFDWLDSGSLRTLTGARETCSHGTILNTSDISNDTEEIEVIKEALRRSVRRNR